MTRPFTHPFLSSAWLAAALAGCGSTSPGPVASDSGPPPFFDPSAPKNLAPAFRAAAKEAAKTYPKNQVLFVNVAGTAAKAGASYEETTFAWTYLFAACDASASPCANTTSISVDYPGWTTSTASGTPLGAYLSKADFANSVSRSLTQIFADAAMQGTTEGSCPIPGSKPPGSIVLEGTFSRTTTWFWQFACGGSPSLRSFDAATGMKI